MKLNPTTSLNECIRRIADKDTGAATVIALLVKDYPDRALDLMHSLDRLEVYGNDIWVAFSRLYERSIKDMIAGICNGTIKTTIAEYRSRV